MARASSCRPWALDTERAPPQTVGSNEGAAPSHGHAALADRHMRRRPRSSRWTSAARSASRRRAAPPSSAHARRRARRALARGPPASRSPRAGRRRWSRGARRSAWLHEASRVCHRCAVCLGIGAAPRLGGRGLSLTVRSTVARPTTGGARGTPAGCATSPASGAVQMCRTHRDLQRHARARRLGLRRG